MAAGAADAAARSFPVTETPKTASKQEAALPKRISVRAETSLTYALEPKEGGVITHLLPFPGLVLGWSWVPVSLEVGLGGYPGFNWMAGARARPGFWRGQSVYLGTQAQFSASWNVMWYQSLEAGFELATDEGFTMVVGGGVYFHIVEFKGNLDSPVTPMGRLGIGWAFIDP